MQAGLAIYFVEQNGNLRGLSGPFLNHKCITDRHVQAWSLHLSGGIRRFDICISRNGHWARKARFCDRIPPFCVSYAQARDSFASCGAQNIFGAPVFLQFYTPGVFADVETRRVWTSVAAWWRKGKELFLVKISVSFKPHWKFVKRWLISARYISCEL